MNLRDVNEKYFGVYVGDVVYTRDPNHLGRIQVRVYEVYGGPEDIKDIQLPWAALCSLFGGFYDGGSHIPYPKGSTVLVVFEQGDRQRPIVLGGMPKYPDYKDKKKWQYGTKGESMGEWEPNELEVDIPKEVRDDREETKAILFKTPKGATLIIEEQDEAEHIRLIDRSGQVIEMSSPVTSQANEGNGAQRGLKNSISGDQLAYADMVGEKATMSLVDLAGQYIRMTAKNGEEKIEVYGCKRQGGEPPQVITILNSPGSEEIRIQDRKGQRIVLKNGGANKHILLQSGNARIRIDGEQNRIWLDAGRVDLNQPGPSGE